MDTRRTWQRAAFPSPRAEAATSDRCPAAGSRRNWFAPAEADFITLGITTAAIILFIGTGGAVLTQTVRSLAGIGIGPDRLLVNALLLNIALIIFGWRRYRELSQEVQERRKSEAHARRLAETDPLTGCLNRRSIDPAADRLIADSCEQGRAVTLVMIDLDNFKQVNDFNGHSMGDRILQQCADRIRGALPENALLARMGGDEFACAVPFDPRRPGDVDRLAGAIIDAIASPIETDNNVLEITASLGLARSDLHDQDEGHSRAAALMHMADVAMYHAKRQGRNCYFWFEMQMESELRFRSQLEAGIRRGISRGEFVPYYEQQIDIQTGELVGFEMLARWHSPTLGVIGPDIFIPIAEQIGVVGDLSESVIRQALRDAGEWDQRLTLAVNISPLQMADPWFSQKLLKLLVEANFPPSRLEVEITESCLHENIGGVRALVTSLKNQGIRISLDDFGTGYNSLSQLRALPFDRIKIDRSFVTNLVENKDSATIVDAIARLGEGMGMPITAEGIETEAVLDRLRTYGRIKGQGYFYGHPKPADATRRQLAAMNLLTDADAPSADLATQDGENLAKLAASR